MVHSALTCCIGKLRRGFRTLVLHWICTSFGFCSLQIPQNGTEGFLTDFTQVNDLKTLNSNTCDQCDSGDPAISYCSDCPAQLCNFCTQAHRRQKQYHSHKTTIVSDDVETQGLAQREQFLSCNIHRKEPLIVFCKTCQCLICRSCIVDTHNGHSFAPVDHTNRAVVEKQVKELAENAS